MASIRQIVRNFDAITYVFSYMEAREHCADAFVPSCFMAGTDHSAELTSICDWRL